MTPFVLVRQSSFISLFELNYLTKYTAPALLQCFRSLADVMNSGVLLSIVAGETKHRRVSLLGLLGHLFARSFALIRFAHGHLFLM